MTQKVHLSFDRRIRNREVSAAIQYGGGSDGWISEAGDRLVEDSEGDLPSGDLGTFDVVGSSGLTVTIGAGEAVVEGAYIATDETFEVGLDAGTDNQTVYVGWQDGLPDTITVGLDSAFSANDHRIAVWEIDTDSTSVTTTRDVRELGQTISAETLIAESLVFTQDITDPNNNTATSLSDPVRVTEEAVTFDESSITVTTNGAAVGGGSVSLSSTATTDTGEQTVALAAGDVDGDGVDEVVFGDANDDNLKIYDVEDDAVTDTGRSRTEIITGDIDGDGVAEVVFTDSGDSIRYYDVQDDSTTDTDETAFNFATGDVDDDGVDEIAYRDGSSNLKYYDVQTDSVTDTGQQAGGAVATGDVDDDGIAEMIFLDGSDNVNIYDVQDSSTTDTGEQTIFIATGDVDDDGVDEIAYRDGDSNLSVYDVQDGSVIGNINNSTYPPTTGDIDGDGVAEVVFRDANDDNLKIYDVQGDSVTDTGERVSGIATGDFDDGGKAGVAIRSFSDDSLLIYDTGPYSGNALIAWDTGTPADIDSWDLATFQRTLDNESVTIDIEDGNTNVLRSDISQDTDISDIPVSTDIQLRVTITQADAANNPTCDYLARRFTR
jgi:hypothetical protein